MGDNELDAIPSQLAAIVDEQTFMGCVVPATLTEIFDLALGWSESAANRSRKFDTEKDRVID